MDSFTRRNQQLLLKCLPRCRPAVLFPPGGTEDVFWAATASRLGGERMTPRCLNVPSGYPHGAKSSVGGEARASPFYLLRVWSS